jgi:YHS domain-containing protein
VAAGRAWSNVRRFTAGILADGEAMPATSVYLAASATCSVETDLLHRPQHCLLSQSSGRIGNPSDDVRSATAAVQPKKAAMPASNLHVLNQEARDPVCGMFVNVSDTKYKSAHHGSEVYFCCAGCKQIFDRQPEKFTSMSSL